MKSPHYAKIYDTAGIVRFDFMQNLPLPAVPVQETFYLWKNMVHGIVCPQPCREQSLNHALK